jgi:hypothetical protein
MVMITCFLPIGSPYMAVGIKIFFSNWTKKGYSLENKLDNNSNR